MEKKNGRFFRRLRRVVIIAFSVIFGLIITALVLAFVFEDKIKSMAIAGLNSHLTAEIRIRSDHIQFSLFRHFPFTSLDFSDFTVLEPGKKERKILARAGQLSLLFNPFKLLSGNYTIQRIRLDDAQVNLFVDKQGKPNYLIWKSSGRRSGNYKNSMAFDLRQMLLKNVRFCYIDDHAHYRASVNIRKAELAGHFNADTFQLGSEAELLAEDLSIDSVRYIDHKNIRFKSFVSVNRGKGTFALQDTRLQVDNAEFRLSGGSSGNRLDYTVQSEKTSIQTLISLLPPKVSSALADYSSEGNISFSAKIKGESASPSIEAEFQLMDARIKAQSHPLALEHVNLLGRFSNGDGHSMVSSSLSINPCSAELNGRPVTASLIYKDFSNPFLNCGFRGIINLSDLQQFASFSSIDTLSGEISIDAKFAGHIHDLQAYADVGKTAFSGYAQLKDVKIIPKNSSLHYTALNGDFSFDGNSLEVKEFTGLASHSDFRLNGSFNNLASFLFLPKQNLEVKAALYAHSIHLEDFFSTSKSDTGHVNGSLFPAFLLCGLDVTADELSWHKFLATDIKGRLDLDSQNLFLSGVQWKTMQGDMALEGKITRLVNSNQFHTYAKARLHNIDIYQLFDRFENFDQSYFVAKNIRGTLNSTLEFNSDWKSDWTADLQSLTVVADLSIDNGHLVQYEPMMKMGKYLKMNKFDNLSFEKLSNHITIREEKIMIPAMEISSNAMDMKLEGIHTFDNIMNYHVRINASQLLFGKKSDYETEFGQVEVDKNGGMKLFLTMKGPASNPQFVPDARNTGKNLVEGFRQEKEDLKNIFRKKQKLGPDGKPLDKTSENLKSRDEDELNWNEKN